MSIVVVGSLNMDLVVSVPRRPRTGETVLGSDVRFVGGGKGANQAIAAARLNGRVHMVGKVGDDPFGSILKANLEAAGVVTDGVQVEKGVSSGVAFITIDEGGDNQIIVSPGANSRLTPENVRAHASFIKKARVLMLQLEIPLPTVLEAARVAQEGGVTVILDPAPARPVPPELLRMVDFLTPNEHEAAALSGQTIKDIKSAKVAAARLIRNGCRQVLIKLGAQGVIFASGNHFEHVPAFPVQTVDTTAAGDAFGAGFAVSLMEQGDVYQALNFASAVGALTATKPGAQPSLPYRKEVDTFLCNQGHKMAE
ncbi:ribokinase [Moorella sp. Hama-1]|uniref:ribokinase n=1 Tax=Moorella sp. Hama-1 TaxID=2138101 RepID=UPI000D64E5D7|nr:ribokinase [Moorella sp. Hama-1]BCV20295.1 ribokinase [Moorella sp. Hama-1]